MQQADCVRSRSMICSQCLADLAGLFDVDSATQQLSVEIFPLVEALRPSLFSTWMVRSREEREGLLILAELNPS